MNKIFDIKTKGERAVVIAMIIGAVIATIILMMLPPVPMVQTNEPNRIYDCCFYHSIYCLCTGG